MSSRVYSSPAARCLASKGYQSLAEQEEQTAAISARGRVESTMASLHSLGGVIDGARFDQFDPANGRITIRVDDSRVPVFWMELNFTLRQLTRWLASHGYYKKKQQRRRGPDKKQNASLLQRLKTYKAGMKQVRRLVVKLQAQAHRRPQ